MNTKILAILNFVVDAVDTYLFSTLQPQFVHSLTKSLNRLIGFAISLSILFLSAWALILSCGFFYLVSIGLTHIQAVLTLLGINLTLLLILFSYLRCCLKKRITSLRRSSIIVIVIYILKVLRSNKL